MTVTPDFLPADSTRAGCVRSTDTSGPHHSRHAAIPNVPVFQSLHTIVLLAVALVVAMLSALVGGVTALAVRPLDFGDVTPATGHGGARLLGGPYERVAAKVLPSVVKLETTIGFQSSEGSGIILRSDGLILTNNHVVAVPTGAKPDQGGATTLVTLADGRTAPFVVVGGDAVSDIAVVRVPATLGLVPITRGSSEHLTVGQNVVAVGSPLGLEGTVTTGVISALHRPVSSGGDSTDDESVFDAIQTDAAINPGNSGGALVDMTGALIGVNSALATTGGDYVNGPGGSIGLGFAIPVEQAIRVADQLVATGKASHTSLGAQADDERPSRGAIIVAITPEGPAAAAGLPLGAVVTKVDDRVIADANTLVAAVRSKYPGDTIILTYTDPTGAINTARVTLGAE
jgi:putative serine protease PepD